MKSLLQSLHRCFRTLLLSLSAVIICIAGNSAAVLAFTADDVQSTIRKTPLFSFNESGCGTNVVGTGTLPAIIPEPYNGAFTAGGQKYNVSPALVAALFTEENFTNTPQDGLAARWQAFPSKHPDPNSGWPISPKHAQGPFQFLPTTWYGHATQDPAAPWDPDPKKADQFGYGADGDGDGTRNPQHLFDGAASAANYVAHNGATVDKPVASWRNAIYNYNHANWYVDAVLAYYNFYNAGAAPGTPENTNPPPSQPGCSSFVGSVNCSGGGAIQAAVAAASLSEVRNKVVCIAKDELARWTSGELQPGSGYKKYSQGRAENWCADFSSWVYNQAGYPLRDGNGGNVPAVSTVRSIGEQNIKFHWHLAEGYTPRPGDLAIHQDNDSSHVNIVTAVNGTRITLLGGNQARYGFNNSIVSEYSTTGFSSDDITGYVSPD